MRSSAIAPTQPALFARYAAIWLAACQASATQKDRNASSQAGRTGASVNPTVGAMRDAGAGNGNHPAESSSGDNTFMQYTQTGQCWGLKEKTGDSLQNTQV